MNNIGNNKGLLIGLVAIICVCLLLAVVFLPLMDESGKDKSEQGTTTGTPLTTYDETVIEPGSNKITGLTNENWFSEQVANDKLTFATDDLGDSEFTSSERDDDLSNQDDTFSGDASAEGGDKDAKTSAPDTPQQPREIEEADIIKLVDDTLYILNTYRGFMIIDVSEPDTPELTSRVPLFGQPVEMYIVEPRAYVILTHYYNTFLWAEGGDTEPEYRHGSEIVVIDIANPADPEVQQYIELNGFITNTRRVGEVIYAVTNNYDGYGYYGFDGIDMGVGIKAEVESSGTREGTVDSGEDDPDGGDEVVSTEPDSEPEPKPKEEKKESSYDEEYSYEEFVPKEGTVVVSINMENLDNIVEVDRETFLGTSNEIHVTENAIFVAQPEYNYYQDPIFGYIEEYYTKITYVDISDYHGDIKLRDTFAVDGYLEDRYQMDYYEGTFRIVTHFWGEWDKLGESKLWIFDTQNPDDIKKKGELLIDDAGSLMATRFAGERAYTIHLPYSVDPLDVIDLSNPSKPVLTDILEIPGWVTHMEVRGFKILALGVDDSEGKQKVAVSLFDVSDPYEAVMEDRVIIGDEYSWSTANWDPKALSVIDDQNLILV
ncbi:MAG: beta-propeller domain-containing protein, partial [Planctomycetota bacterium]